MISIAIVSYYNMYVVFPSFILCLLMYSQCDVITTLYTLVPSYFISTASNGKLVHVNLLAQYYSHHDPINSYCVAIRP